MSRRGTGVIFIVIATFLYVVRCYITASISFGYPSASLLVWSILSLIIGICYLIAAELPKSVVEKFNKHLKNSFGSIDPDK